MINFTEARDARLAAMTDEQRAVYDEAYDKAGVAMRLAELFYEARVAHDLTQSELARRMRTTQPTIAEIEGGGRVPSVDMLERLAEATGQRLDISLSPVAVVYSRVESRPEKSGVARRRPGRRT